MACARSVSAALHKVGYGTSHALCGGCFTLARTLEGQLDDIECRDADQRQYGCRESHHDETAITRVPTGEPEGNRIIYIPVTACPTAVVLAPPCIVNQERGDTKHEP